MDSDDASWKKSTSAKEAPREDLPMRERDAPRRAKLLSARELPS
jgi:hypothetical protein